MRQFHIQTIASGSQRGNFDVLVRDKFVYRDKDSEELTLKRVNEVKDTFRYTEVSAPALNRLKMDIQNVLTRCFNEGLFVVDDGDDEENPLDHLNREAPKYKYNLISFVWRRRGSTNSNYANHITKKTPVEWLKAFLNDDEEVAILNVSESIMTEDEYEELKDLIN